MNRKLVNGMLLLSVATAACGSFSSCKDTDENYRNEIMVDLNDAQKRLAELEKQYPAMAGDIQKILAYLGATDASQLNGTVSDLIKQLIDKNVNPNKIYTLISSILQQIDSQVTDITLNQAYNPIFGTLNLPIGLNTTILANYYGETMANVSFPFATANAEVGDVEGVEENAEALAALGFQRVSVVAGTPYMDEASADNNLGQLYVTVNPIGLDLDNFTFTLVNSQDEAAPIVLTPAITDEVLTHGYTRSLTSKNGFYRVNAQADVNSLEQLGVRIEPGLAAAFKDFIQNPGKQDLADLGMIIFKQLDGFLPAYGIKATWQTPGATSADATPNGTFTPSAITNSAVSKYEIAATAFQPLGYEFLQDVTISKRLPTYGPVSDAVNNLLADLKNQAKIDFSSSSLNIGATSIQITLGGLMVDGQAVVDANGKTPVITLGYDPASGKVSDKGNLTALNPLVGQIVEQVNAMLQSMQGDINGQLAQIVQNIQNRLNGKLGAADKLLGKYNALAQKVNNFLAAPNDYIQVSLALKGFDGNLHRVATDANDPTTVSGTGTGELFLTSPTAELIAPAYKKAVANLTTGQILGGGVLSGRQTSIPLQASDLAQGLNKIVYSALDYRGKTSTRFFYIYKN